MRKTLLTAVLVMVCVTAWAGLDATGTMRYSYQAGATTTGELVAQIDGLELGGGVPMAVTGSLRVKQTLEVVAVDEQGVATIKMSFGQLQAEFMGQRQATESLEPVLFNVDNMGRPVQREEAEGRQAALLAGGGVPIQLIAVLAGVVPMPEEPVKMGEDWTVETEAAVAGVGNVSMTTTSHVVEVAEGVATIASTVQAALPEMTTPNPMGGGEVLLREGQLVIADFVREVSLESGLVSSASGQMTLDCRANLGGMGEMPLRIMGSFELSPPEEGQAAQPPAVTPAPTAPQALYLQWGQVAWRQMRMLLARLPWLWGGQQ